MKNTIDVRLIVNTCVTDAWGDFMNSNSSCGKWITSYASECQAAKYEWWTDLSSVPLCSHAVGPSRSRCQNSLDQARTMRPLHSRESSISLSLTDHVHFCSSMHFWSLSLSFHLLYAFSHFMPDCLPPPFLFSFWSCDLSVTIVTYCTFWQHFD